MTSLVFLVARNMNLHFLFVFLLVRESANVLKGIPQILSPELLEVMASMGHGDRLVIGDSNFPAASVSSAGPGGRLVRADGHSIPDLLEAILRLFPLDTQEAAPVGYEC